MATKDESAMARIEADIRAVRDRMSGDIARVQGFVHAWRSFIGMFTASNARDKASDVMGDAAENLVERAQRMGEKLVNAFKR